MDPAYATRVAQRAIALERRGIALHERLARTEREIVRADDTLSAQLVDIKEELRELDAACRTAADGVARTVDLFSRVVKQGDMRHLQEKVDAWAPEKRITRGQLRRMLS